MPAFLARSTTSLFKRSVTFLLEIGRMTYVQKVFGDLLLGFTLKRHLKYILRNVKMDCNQQVFQIEV